MFFEDDIRACNIDFAISFCKNYEATSVNLLDALLNAKKAFFDRTPLDYKKARIFYSDKEIIAVALINTHNFFLYCFPNFSDTLYKLIMEAFNFQDVYALMGEGASQEELQRYIKKYFGINAHKSIDYILMTHSAPLSPQSSFRLPHSFILNIFSNLPYSGSNTNLNVRMAKESDLDAILPLQLAYEKEEVWIGKTSIPQYFVRANLEILLKENIVYIATLNDIPIAKANTNAEGVEYFQVGGIYTVPKYRRCGVASYLLKNMFLHLYRKKKHIALFVKKENDIAINMYKKIGLAEMDKFRISYYK